MLAQFIEHMRMTKEVQGPGMDQHKSIPTSGKQVTQCNHHKEQY